jgi:hypothetical protein
VTTPHLAGHPATSQQAIVDAALLMLRQMGLSPDDLVTAPQDRPPVPTFAEYVPVVSAAVTAGTRRAYGSYWNRIIDHWGERRLDEIAPSEIRQLMSYVKTHVVARRNARGGRSATWSPRCAACTSTPKTTGSSPPVRTPPGRWTSPAACPPPAGPSPTTGSPRSARPPQTAATIQSWIRCCCGCTPRPPASPGVPSLSYDVA